MYGTILFLHLLSAAIAFVALVTFSAYALGAPAGRLDFAIADWAWNISGAGVIVFGVWLAIDVDGYALWDGWILVSLILFVAAAAFGARARARVAAPAGDGAADGTRPHATLWHWLRTVAVLAILALMIWKPGA